MRYNLRRLTILMVCLFVNMLVYSQFNNNRLFATYDDYLAGKYVEGYELVQFSWAKFAKETIKLKQGGKTEKVKLTELPAELLKYDFKLMRVFNGEMNIVLHIGPMCLYTWYGDNSGLYYSANITGEIKSLSDKYFENLLKEKGLLESYKAAKPKRERQDTPSSYLTKSVSRVIDYLIKMEEIDKKVTEE